MLLRILGMIQSFLFRPDDETDPLPPHGIEHLRVTTRFVDEMRSHGFRVRAPCVSCIRIERSSEPGCRVALNAVVDCEGKRMIAVEINGSYGFHCLKSRLGMLRSFFDPIRIEVKNNDLLIDMFKVRCETIRIYGSKLIGLDVLSNPN